MLRNGYTDRNPVDSRWRREMQQRINLLGGSDEDVPELWVDEDTTSTGLIIIGSSGMGKTRTIHRILRLYPQIIRHIGYRRNRDFIEIQIVYVTVDCPHNGSLLALITEVFGKIDRLAHTNHSANYIRGGRTAEALLPYLHRLAYYPAAELLSDEFTRPSSGRSVFRELWLARVALLHHLGILVIDEVQDLSAAGVGYAEMLRFFVKLSNIVRIPIVLIGTPAATRILAGEFRMTRRGSDQGDLIWDRFVRGAVWDLFCAALERYQYTRTPHTLDGPLGDALLDLSDGIVDVAKAIYKRSQTRVIDAGGAEVLTVEEMERAAEEDFQHVQAAIRSRRNGAMNRAKGTEIADIDDVRPTYGAPQAAAVVPASPLTTERGQHDLADAGAEPAPPRRVRRARPKAVPKGARGLLPSVGVAAATEGITLVDALRRARLVNAPLAYLDGSVAA